MRINYLFDPLCGWCYGAGPAIARLAALSKVALELSPTGLFAEKAARPLDAAFAEFAWQNDRRIARLTGRSFSEAYKARILDPGDKIFDSTPTTLAVVAVKRTEPGREFEALETLQVARYQDGRDTSVLETVIDILESAGLAVAAQALRKPDDALRAAYRESVLAARTEMAAIKAEGVPALVIREGNSRRLLKSSMLFSAFEDLEAQLIA